MTAWKAWWGLVCGLALVYGPGRLEGATPPPEGGDGWATEVVVPPEFGTPLGTSGFGTLSAVAADRYMVVRWMPSRALSSAPGSPGIQASTDTPGKRILRDWRSWPMTRAAGGAFEARIPVASIDVPTAYFLTRFPGVPEGNRGVPEVTAAREFWPRVAGMTEPTEPFRGFVEGFEEGLRGWELVSVRDAGDAGRGLVASTNALSGSRALRLEIPPGRGSVTVGTVRVRGWMLTEHRVEAIRIAARTESGEGRLGVALHSRARTGADALAVHPARGEFRVLPTWQRLEIPIEAFVGLRPYWVDWLTFQFFGESGTSLVLDDLELVLR